MPIERRSGDEPECRRGRRVEKPGDMDEFWSDIGVDVEGMSPRAQAVTGLVPRITPVQAAMETSLTVSEADKMLGELAEGGHLDVRVRGGGLFYALWDRGGGDGGGELERR